jgi:ferrous iron transport protein A
MTVDRRPTPALDRGCPRGLGTDERLHGQVPAAPGTLEGASDILEGASDIMVPAPCALLTCSLCGQSFAPADNAACGGCPLHGGCRMVCCPHCGHTTIDPSQSQLVRFGARLLRLIGRHGSGTADDTALLAGRLSLADVRPGERARVIAIDGLGPAEREQLQSYGLLPGRDVRVLQHAPATVIQVDQTELAFEDDIARKIRVAGPR